MVSYSINAVSAASIIMNDSLLNVTQCSRCIHHMLKHIFANVLTDNGNDKDIYSQITNYNVLINHNCSKNLPIG